MFISTLYLQFVSLLQDKTLGSRLLEMKKMFNHSDSSKFLSFMESTEVVKGDLQISESEYSIKISSPYVKYPERDNYNIGLQTPTGSS